MIKGLKMEDFFQRQQRTPYLQKKEGKSTFKYPLIVTTKKKQLKLQQHQIRFYSI